MYEQFRSAFETTPCRRLNVLLTRSSVRLRKDIIILEIAHDQGITLASSQRHQFWLASDLFKPSSWDPHGWPSSARHMQGAIRLQAEWSPVNSLHTGLEIFPCDLLKIHNHVDFLTIRLCMMNVRASIYNYLALPIQITLNVSSGAIVHFLVSVGS